MPVIRSKDLAQTPAESDARTKRRGMRQAEDLRSSFSRKKWSELTPPEREQLLRALAVHFGFIAPD